MITDLYSYIYNIVMIYLCPSKMVDIDYSLYIRYGNYTISMFTCSSSFNDSLNNILYL